MDDHNNHVWYHKPLFVALVTIILTLLITQISSCIDRCFEKKNRDIALKLAFSGEISAIRGTLESANINTFNAWKQGKTLKSYYIKYPNSVFQANASNLGYLKDRELIKHLSILYSVIDRTNEFARRMDEGVYGANSIDSYLFYLANVWNMSMLLDMRLREHTKQYKELDWQVVSSKKDAADKNSINEILIKLKAKKQIE